MCLAEVAIAMRHAQQVRSDEVETRVEERECLHETVYGASVLEVAHHGDVDIVECTLGLPDAVQVEHGLRRMLVSAVACIDDRHVGHFAGIACCTFEVVTHHDDIGIVRHHLDSVLERLALRRRTAVWIAESDDTCAKTVAGCFKTEACAC